MVDCGIDARGVSTIAAPISGERLRPIPEVVAIVQRTQIETSLRRRAGDSLQVTQPRLAFAVPKGSPKVPAQNGLEDNIGYRLVRMS